MLGHERTPKDSFFNTHTSDFHCMLRREDLVVLSANQTWAKVLTMELATIRGQCFLDFIVPEKRDRVRQTLSLADTKFTFFCELISSDQQSIQLFWQGDVHPSEQHITLTGYRRQLIDSNYLSEAAHHHQLEQQQRRLLAKFSHVSRNGLMMLQAQFNELKKLLAQEPGMTSVVERLMVVENKLEEFSDQLSEFVPPAMQHLFSETQSGIDADFFLLNNEPDPNKQLKVLVVDDNPSIRLIYKHILSKAQLPFRLVNDGVEALAALADEVFDVIFMDIVMPNMDGIQATRAIKSKKLAEQSVIFAASAQSTLAEVLRAYDAGVDGYLLKPLKRPMIYGALQYAWKQKQCVQPAPASSSVSTSQTSGRDRANSIIDELTQRTGVMISKCFRDADYQSVMNLTKHLKREDYDALTALLDELDARYADIYLSSTESSTSQRIT